MNLVTVDSFWSRSFMLKVTISSEQVRFGWQSGNTHIAFKIWHGHGQNTHTMPEPCNPALIKGVRNYVGTEFALFILLVLRPPLKNGGPSQPLTWNQEFRKWSLMNAQSAMLDGNITDAWPQNVAHKTHAPSGGS